MNKTMPNPGLEGYRTAHEQEEDGSYGLTVMPADLVVRKDHISKTFQRIDRRQHAESEQELGPDTAQKLLDILPDLEDGRRITKRMEQAYRLRHHDFGGLNERRAAERMGVGQDAVRRLLWKMCKIAPQLFPILTPAQARAWHLWMHEGMSHSMIANSIGVTISSSKQLVGRAKKKLDYHKVLNQRLLVMDPREIAKLEIGNEIVNVF